MTCCYACTAWDSHALHGMHIVVVANIKQKELMTVSSYFLNISCSRLNQASLRLNLYFSAYNSAVLSQKHRKLLVTTNLLILSGYSYAEGLAFPLYKMVLWPQMTNQK